MKSWDGKIAKAMNNKEKTLSVGARGEAEAIKYFKKHGYCIIEQNYRHSHYEIDFIAEDDECLVFVEVKSRSCTDPDNMPYGRPSSAVTYSKKQRLISAARAYMHERKFYGKRVRLDVVEIFFDTAPDVKSKKVIKINHIRNAFGA